MQSVAKWDYKVCLVGVLQSVATADYKVWQNGLQSLVGITKCGRVDYKVRQGLQSVAGLQSELVHTMTDTLH